MRETLVQPFRAGIHAPFQPLYERDGLRQTGEGLFKGRLRVRGRLLLELQQHDVPDHGSPPNRRVALPEPAQTTTMGTAFFLPASSPLATTRPRTRSAAFSPIMMAGAFVLELTRRGITELSQTRKPSMPRTRS